VTKILVIEDEPSIRQFLVDICIKLGKFEAQGVENGVVGIQKAREYLPDLIICDIMMPGLDGYGVLEALRNDPAFSTAQFILLTARAERTSMRRCMELGADDYIVKPFSTAELLSAINARLKRQAAIAEASVKSLQETRRKFMQLVTHELRTPIISINTAVEIVSRQAGQLSPEQFNDLVEAFSMGGKRLSRLIDQIVFITQLDNGLLTQDAIKESGLPVQFWNILTVAVDLARRFAYRHPDVRVRLDERDIQAQVWCDKMALKHALAELITNALSFSPENEEVTVSQWEADNYLWVTILDAGPGITPDELSRVLDGFYQVRRETKEQQGMGVGLSLARRIIEAHSGALEVLSVPGKGTQIQIKLPVLPQTA
jgi:signal transduction histidine kinase